MIELIEWEDEAITLDNMGEKIHKLRKRSGMSCDTLGKRAGISGAAIWRMENGAHCPNSYVLFCTLEALGKELVMRDKR